MTMATTRTPIDRPPIAQITPKIIELYCKVLALYDNAMCDKWEEDGDKGREYLDTCLALHVALGRKPWETTIVATIEGDEPPYWLQCQGVDRIRDWLAARAIRMQLDASIR